MCYDIMGLNFNALVLSKGLMIIVGVLRAWVADNKETEQEVGDHKNQSHPKHPSNSCQIHDDQSQQISSLNFSSASRSSRLKQVHKSSCLPLPSLKIWNNRHTHLYFNENLHQQTKQKDAKKCHCGLLSLGGGARSGPKTVQNYSHLLS